MSVSATLRIAASRAAHLAAAIDDDDRSTPTKMPRWVSLDNSLSYWRRIGGFTHDRRTTFPKDHVAMVTDLFGERPYTVDRSRVGRSVELRSDFGEQYVLCVNGDTSKPPRPVACTTSLRGY